MSNKPPGNEQTLTSTDNPLSKTGVAFIGCGVMAEAIIAGLLRKNLVSPAQIVGSHPRATRREELYAKYGFQVLESNRDAALASHPTTAEGSSMIILSI